jgi:hypothetical protein
MLMWALIALSVPTLACRGEDEQFIRWENPTSQHLIIFIGDDLDDLEADLAPCTAKEQPMTKDRWQGMVLVGASLGDEAYRRQLSWEQLERDGFRVTIDQELLPTPIPPSRLRHRTCPDPLPNHGPST